MQTNGPKVLPEMRRDSVRPLGSRCMLLLQLQQVSESFRELFCPQLHSSGPVTRNLLALCIGQTTAAHFRRGRKSCLLQGLLPFLRFGLRAAVTIRSIWCYFPFCAVTALQLFIHSCRLLLNDII